MSKEQLPYLALPYLAITVAVFLFVVMVVSVVKACGYSSPCSDYSYKISRIPFTHKVATCTKWPDMQMGIDKGVLSGTLVNCTCPEN